MIEESESYKSTIYHRVNYFRLLVLKQEFDEYAQQGDKEKMKIALEKLRNFHSTFTVTAAEVYNKNSHAVGKRHDP